MIYKKINFNVIIYIFLTYVLFFYINNSNFVFNNII